MNKKPDRTGQAKLLRTVRKIHRFLGATLFLLFLVIAITGLLLGWKKHSGGWIQAKTATGSSKDLKKWLPMDSLYQRAVEYLKDSVDASLSPALEKIDIRADKGIAKFIFSQHFTGLQLDGATGEILLVEERRSDLIEKIHDGSIVDMKLLGNGAVFKLIFTSIAGLSLLLFTLTGFWLWYGPKRMKRGK
ncbi:PepSY-associated TM helix domain-containing protein [Flavihumibacter sp. CACIAM 22H1]|uniref:PepSY-associated TM helix domain-containing protein n=1 Tax=Flavihumibacter sp. CACIAM 22H1 TaxID=1812911 RepID=UPI0007A85F18|nr:PepSY-associated TM helix domain-containing protein [Flavihumibacter sp. CACIAM 22H1]KYP14474.1 MAG: DNA mismatch repair protein [Flavihumibacter sp. CACIAM 22H1]